LGLDDGDDQGGEIRISNEKCFGRIFEDKFVRSFSKKLFKVIGYVIIVKQ
jgi:hypothetical protein